MFLEDTAKLNFKIKQRTPQSRQTTLTKNKPSKSPFISFTTKL
jgi:hypothetical protein